MHWDQFRLYVILFEYEKETGAVLLESLLWKGGVEEEEVRS